MCLWSRSLELEWLKKKKKGRRRRKRVSRSAMCNGYMTWYVTVTGSNQMCKVRFCNVDCNTRSWFFSFKLCDSYHAFNSVIYICAILVQLIFTFTFKFFFSWTHFTLLFASVFFYFLYLPLSWFDTLDSVIFCICLLVCFLYSWMFTAEMICHIFWGW